MTAGGQCEKSRMSSGSSYTGMPLPNGRNGELDLHFGGPSSIAAPESGGIGAPPLLNGGAEGNGTLLALKLCLNMATDLALAPDATACACSRVAMDSATLGDLLRADTACAKVVVPRNRSLGKTPADYGTTTAEHYSV